MYRLPPPPRMRNQKTSLENKSKHASKMHSIHWEFLNDRFLRITYTYTKTQCFFFPCKIKFYTWQKWKFVPVKNKCPWKNLKNPRKELVKIFLKVCPWNSKRCPWKKNANYARETIQNPLVNTQFQPVKTHLFPVKKSKKLLKNTREKQKWACKR